MPEVALGRHVVDGIVEEHRIEAAAEPQRPHVTTVVLALGVQSSRHLQHPVGAIHKGQGERRLQVHGVVTTATSQFEDLPPPPSTNGSGTSSCRPWQFRSVDYLSALAGLAPVVAELPVLNGAQVGSCWDEQLTTEMAREGRAVHEELLLSDLIVDLS